MNICGKRCLVSISKKSINNFVSADRCIVIDPGEIDNLHSGTIIYCILRTGRRVELDENDYNNRYSHGFIVDEKDILSIS